MYRDQLTAEVKERWSRKEENIGGIHLGEIHKNVVQCANIVVAVRVPEVTSSGEHFSVGKGVVLQPQEQAGQEVPISIPKKIKGGETVKQCVNIVME